MAETGVQAKYLVTVEREKSLLFAARQMKQHHVGTLVVVEGVGRPPRPIGLLTDRDIVLKGVAEEVDLATTRVREIMSRNLVMVNESEGYSKAISQMQEKRVRVVLIVDDEGCVTGILSSDDLVQMLGDEVADIARTFQEQASENNTMGRLHEPDR